MRMFVFLICLALSFNALALGGYDSLSGDDKKVTDNIKNNLSISESDAYRIYNKFLKGFLNSKDWEFNSYDNESLDSSKVGKSANKTAFFNFVTDNRYINLTFIKFPDEKQVLIQSIETLPRSSEDAIEKYNSLKADSAWIVGADKPNFSIFSQKNTSSKVKILINSGVGAIQYVDFFTLDLKN